MCVCVCGSFIKKTEIIEYTGYVNHHDICSVVTIIVLSLVMPNYDGYLSIVYNDNRIADHPIQVLKL